uniref:KRAB domain-containing protein n=1 Tax=Oryctolagus cuniculus TaxID=9986 RepID=A0A5F9C292_RABIT
MPDAPVPDFRAGTLWPPCSLGLSGPLEFTVRGRSRLEGLSFEDLTVYFTHEEWQDLDDAQRTPYREVMHYLVNINFQSTVYGLQWLPPR